MKLTSILMALLWSGTAVLAQTPKENSIRYNALIAQASIAAAKDDPQAALPLYDAAFALANWGLYNYFEATDVALAAERPDKANEYLLLGVKHGMDPTAYYDSLYAAFLASAGSKPFKDDWNAARIQFAAHADSTVIKRLQH